MARVVWFVLKDGRSVVAGCGAAATRDSFASAIASPSSTVIFTSDDAIERIPGSAIRGFVFFDCRKALPASSAIYRLVHV